MDPTRPPPSRVVTALRRAPGVVVLGLVRFLARLSDMATNLMRRPPLGSGRLHPQAGPDWAQHRSRLFVTRCQGEVADRQHRARHHPLLRLQGRALLLSGIAQLERDRVQWIPHPGTEALGARRVEVPRDRRLTVVRHPWGRRRELVEWSTGDGTALALLLPRGAVDQTWSG